MYWKQTSRGIPHDRGRRAPLAILVLAAAVQIAVAQTTEAPPEAGRPPTVGEVAGADVGKSGELTTVTPAVAASACARCPNTRDELLLQRIDALAVTIESAASQEKLPPADRWEDSKAVLLNVISNRLDAWLFGEIEGGAGFAVQIVAILAFAIALARLMMAIALLKPATPPTRWGRFKAWTRKSGVVRATNVVIGTLAVVFTGAALYVVVSARNAPDAAQASFAALEKNLQTCQTTLSSAVARPQVLVGRSPPATAAPPILPDALDRIRQSCDAGIRATDRGLAFLVSVYLIVAVTVLLNRE
jgi:hypothetical protein